MHMPPLVRAQVLLLRVACGEWDMAGFYGLVAVVVGRCSHVLAAPEGLSYAVYLLLQEFAHTWFIIVPGGVGRAAPMYAMVGLT
jgi:hypothetical protein